MFRTSECEYDEIVFKKFCGSGDDREKIFHVGDIIQVVDRFALEENCIDWIVISINMFFQVLITTK